MKYVVSAIAAIYGVLCVIAAFSSVKDGKKGDTSAIIISGCALLESAAIICILGYSFDWINALSGCLLISIAAFINGRRGEFHARHHIVRAVIEAALVVGFILL